MKLSGSYTFSAPRELVWELLNDPATLQRITPGCERLEQIDENRYSADIKLGLAGVRGDYSGTIMITEQRAPEHYRLAGDGRGKPGFARGAGTVDLEAQPDGGTVLRYNADIQVGGPVAQVGQRLIDAAAKSIMNQGFKAFAAELEARQAARQPSEGPAPSMSPPVADMPDEGTAGERPEAEAARARGLEAEVAEASVDVPTTPQGENAQPAVAPADQSTQPAVPQTSWSGPAISEWDVVRGMAEDLVVERPWLRWALPLFVGVILGILIGRGSHQRIMGTD